MIDASKIRDRVRELIRMRARDLRPSPLNWRVHGPDQLAALRGLMAEIGFAGVILGRRLPDGAVEILDGHARAETLPDMEVPVLILDLNDSEARKLLATYDPLGSMAGRADGALASLLASISTDNEAVRGLLDSMKPELAEALGDTNLAENRGYETLTIVCSAEEKEEILSILGNTGKEDIKEALLWILRKS